MSLEVYERIQNLFFFLSAYIILIAIITAIRVFILVNRKTQHINRGINSYDVFPNDEKLEEVALISNKIDRIESDKRVFKTDIFDTIKSGLIGNDSLSIVKDCD